VFQKLTGDVQGPLEVKGALEIDGTLHGGAVVTGTLDLRGTCNGPIEVRLEGSADVEAVVHGDVHARGGKLRFRGIIDGRLGVKEEADVLVAVGTVLNGRRLESDGSFTPISGQGSFQIPDDAPMMRPQQDGNWTPAS
jgi:cytoskeletal protein CcmA (bactofilin family)